MARHTYKVGADYRKIGLDFYAPGNGAGFFEFDKDITSSNGGNSSTMDGNAFASFLLGFPSSRLGPAESDHAFDAALKLFTHYYRRLRAG